MDFICHMSDFLCLERSVKMRGDCLFCFVDICGIDDHHCLNFLCIVMNANVVFFHPITISLVVYWLLCHLDY